MDTTEPGKVLIAVPIHNCEIFLHRLTSQILALDYPTRLLRVAFVENDSTDSSFSCMCKQTERLREAGLAVCVEKMDTGILIPRDRRWDSNLAFQNLRIKKLSTIRQHIVDRFLGGCDWVFWLDADVVHVPSGAIRELVCLDLDMVIPLYVNESGRVFDKSSHLLSTGGRIVLVPEIIKKGMTGPVEMAQVNAAALVRGTVYDKVSYLPPDPSGNQEGPHLSILARRAGFRVWFEPRVKLVHSND